MSILISNHLKKVEMKKIHKPFMAALMLLFTGAIYAQTVWNNATPPIISGSTTVTIATGASGTLVVPGGATVTINSSGTELGTVNINGSNYNVVDNGSRQITLNIGEDATVIWRANYLSLSTSSIVSVLGIGTLNVAAGGIINIDRGNAISTSSNSTIVVSGGAVMSNPSASTNTAATINSTEAGGSVNISDGEVVVLGFTGGGMAIKLQALLA